MTVATVTLHRIAGAPRLDDGEDVIARCIVCGYECARTVEYKRWAGKDYTDQNKMRGHGLSDRICEPCAWAHSWTPPPDRAPTAPGERGLNMRLFSHFWSERTGYVSLNKAQKPAIRDWLRARVDGERWWAGISDSGQKHVLPWIREQRKARGVIRFEERDCTIGDWSVVDTITAALTAGVTKEEITTAQYGSRAWTIAESHVRELRALADQHDGSAWWTLSIWMAQRDEAAVAARMDAEKAAREAKVGRSTAKRGRAGRGGESGDGAPIGVPAERSERARPLGSSPVASDLRAPVERDGRAGGDGVSDAPPAGRAQLSLF
jgi:hypothetical protein